MRPQEATLTVMPQDWAETTFKALAPRLWRALVLYSGRGLASVSHPPGNRDAFIPRVR